MRTKSLIALSLFFAFALGSFAQTAAQPANTSWKLTWSDEFNAADGSAPDPSKWVYATGGKGWGNNELETYTDRRVNSSVQGGNLVITALKEKFTGADGVARDYTSARLISRGKFSQKYGRFEARIKMPSGQGIWPAFWMLGDDHDQAGWPTCGEIDIMETIGSTPNLNHGSMHGPGYSGGNPLTGVYTHPSSLADDFHVYAIEWEPEVVRFYVDDNLYETRTPKDLPEGKKWVYDHPFYFLLNVAVGGNWPKDPDATTVFPQKMLVDYVRAYERR